MRKILILLLVLLLAVPVLATEAEPTNVPREPGYCGESIVWEFRDGLLTITGTGKMDDFPEGAPWEEHKDEIQRVIISGGITYVGSYAFCDYDKLTEVEFGDDIYEIGERAFFSCDGLTEIHLPASFKVFGPSSFMGCTKLKEIHCQGKFPSFRQNCLWDTYATIYFPVDRPWSVSLIQELEEAFHGRIEFRASDGSDPYVPTEATEAPTQAPTEAPTQPPATQAPTQAPTEAPVTQAPTEAETVPEVTQTPTQAPTEAPEPTEPEQEPEKQRSRSWIGLVIIAVVALVFVLGGMIFGGGRKRGRYSR